MTALFARLYAALWPLLPQRVRTYLDSIDMEPRSRG